MITSTTAELLYEPLQKETQALAPRLYIIISKGIIMEVLALDDTFKPEPEAVVIETDITAEWGLPAQWELAIRDLHDSRLCLREPITISLENDGYQFIAYAPDLDIYGWGDTEYEAIEDLRQSIVELYFDLKGEKLAPSLRKIWDYLNSIVEEIESPRSQESI